MASNKKPQKPDFKPNFGKEKSNPSQPMKPGMGKGSDEKGMDKSGKRAC